MKNTYVFLLVFLAANIHSQVLPAHVAGSWYAADPSALTQQLTSLNAQAEKKYAAEVDGSHIRALIVPHAGYQFSGAVAAAAFKLVDPTAVEKVIILGPSHFVPFKGIAIPPFSAFQIPAGSLRVDTQTLKKLPNNSLFKKMPQAFSPEHSIEAELPFIHYYFPQAQIIPLVVGDVTRQEIITIARTLAPLISAKSLVVVSSDFIHYGPQYEYTPFADQQLLRTQQLDSRMLMAIQNTDLKEFRNILTETGATVCGRIPIQILLELIKQHAFGTTQAQLIAYATSAAVSGETENFVTYASVIVTQQPAPLALNMQEKNSLVRYAREILTHALKKEQKISPELLAPVLTPNLVVPKGVFVTLYSIKNGTKELRGCIGTVLPQYPLYKAVAYSVLASAFNDPRFAPVEKDELSSLILDISVLTLPRPIKSYKDIVLNKNGIILTQGTASALFLPKVPEEFGFTLKQTLQELSKKAGLSANAWQQPSTAFQVFDSVDFGELDIPANRAD